MNMKIVEKEGFNAIGIRVSADWKNLHVEMPGAWNHFKQRLEEISNRKNEVMMDLSLSKEGDTYTQLIGVEVEEFEEVPEDMTTVSIPKQAYIYYRHKGDLSGIASSFGKMYDWAEENRIKAEEFKIDYGYLEDGSETSHDLYVKIASQ